jgi:hypothetical protein
VRTIGNRPQFSLVSKAGKRANPLSVPYSAGWELAAWIATKNGRAALALAFTDMIRNGEVSRASAEEIAIMVLRTNAETLYKLELLTGK